MLYLLLTLLALPANAQTSVAPGSQGVPLLSFTLEADCSQDAVIYGISLRHRGLGSLEDITSVYAMVGSRRVSRGRSFASRDGRISIPLRRFSIPACSSLPLIIAADFSPSASVAGEHSLVLDGQESIDADGDVKISVTPSQRRVRASGTQTPSLTVSYLNLTRRLLYGEKRTVSRIRLQGDTRYHQRLSSITFTNDGTARDTDLRNLRVTDSRFRPLTNTVPALTGDSVQLRFLPNLTLMRNERKTLQLRADIRGGSTRTIRFIIEEPSDITARRLRGRR